MAFKRSALTLSSYFVLPTALLLIIGCESDAPNSSSSPPVTPDMSEDFSHNHEHSHGPEHDHGHSHHGDTNGSHQHEHSHAHRHGETPHDGRIVSIGHTHHKVGETYYHAEVLPITDGMLAFHVLIEDEDGELQEYSVEETEIFALVNESGASADLAIQITFIRDSTNKSQFTADIPASLADAERLTVVVPKIKLGKGRLNFKFEGRPSLATVDPAAGE